MRIHLASAIISGEVDVDLVDQTRYLDVSGCPEELHAGEGTRGHDAGAVAGFAAPGDRLSLSVPNCRVWNRWAPDAEI